MRLTRIGAPLEMCDVPAPVAGEGEVLVNLRCAALNRRDFWMQQGQYPRIDLPVTPGSDGAGICEGREVVIDPGLDWGNSESFQSSAFHILGMPRDGTLAETVTVPLKNVYPKPPHLSWEEAAALPLAGVSAYRAVFVQGKAQPGQKVLITGVGGGVALTAMQLCIAYGMEVVVTSGSEEKLAHALALGAAGAVNYKDPDWAKSIAEQHGTCDLVLDSAGGEAFAALPKLTSPGGRIVIYGGTLGKIQDLSPQVLYWRQIAIIGSTMGSASDFRAMLAFVSHHEIKPVVDRVFDLDNTNEALDKLRDGTQFGKVVIRIS